METVAMQRCYILISLNTRIFELSKDSSLSLVKFRIWFSSVASTYRPLSVRLKIEHLSYLQTVNEYKENNSKRMLCSCLTSAFASTSMSSSKFFF